MATTSCLGDKPERFDEKNSVKGKSKHEDKIRKKILKIKGNLSVKEGVEISEDPSKILCIQNGGLGNNVSQEDLYPILSVYGHIQDFIMIPMKQFCFVCFDDEKSSREVLTNLNGHLLRKGKDPSQDVILYFLYVTKAPANVMSSGEKPAGLHILEDFIDEDKERQLLSFVEHQLLTQATDVSGQMKHRRVLHFGYEFKYDINDVDINDPLPAGIPDVCHSFLQKVQESGLVKDLPDQLTINQYMPGQGIPPHIDTPPAFEDGIMSLSLGSAALMDFRHPEKGKHLAVLLPQRSLLVMTGESRYSWSHGITPRKSDIVSAGEGKGLTLVHRDTRTSFTFRKVIKDRSDASENNSQSSQVIPHTEKEAVALERLHVHRVYNDIANHFSGTRYKPWPNVVEFLLEQPSHSFVADVGCGNGKCLGAKKDLFEIGCDYSENLATICASRGFQTCVADVTSLPYRSSAFDVVICIAVIHHMSTRARRIRAISEVIRILRGGGKALIYVWAMEQNMNQNPSKYIKSNRQKHMDTSSFSDNVTKEGLDPCKSAHCPSSVPSNSNQSAGTISIRRKENAPDISAKNQTNTETDDSTSDQPEKGCESENVALTNDTRNIHSIATANDQKSEDVENTKSRQLRIHVNRTQFQEQDLLVPWKLKGRTASGSKESLSSDASLSEDPQLFHRYYHVFRQGELEALCKRVPGCVVRKSYHDQGNWCAVLEKT